MAARGNRMILGSPSGEQVQVRQTLDVASADARLSQAVGTTVHCFPALASYFTDSGIAPTKYWIGIAGFWGYSPSYGQAIIGLTPNTCMNLAALVVKHTWVNDYAVFVLSHEEAHASGLASAYTAVHATADPVFAADVAAIEAQYGLSAGQAAEEAGADCVGASRISAVAYTLGLRGHLRFKELLRQAQLVSGYVKIPAECWHQKGTAERTGL